MSERLKYVSEAVFEGLFTGIETNLDRYANGSFEDLAKNVGWSIELKLNADIEGLAALDAGKSDIENAYVVWQCLGELSPALATENRIWTRLSHIECLPYSRARWIRKPEDVNVENIKKHFFANTLTRYRDDHAISRLWWSAYIASRALPDNPKLALEQIFKTADIRSNIIERPWIGSRPAITGGIVRAMVRESWLTEREQNFREFMKNVNKFGGGKMFEMMNDNDVDAFVASCYTRLK